MKRYIKSDYDEFNISDASYTELEDAIIELRATLRSCKDPRKRANIVNQIYAIQKELDSRWAQDITSSEDIDDDDDDWLTAQIFPKRYRIQGGDYYSETVDNAGAAIGTWFKLQKKYPHDCAIQTQTKANAKELLAVVANNPDPEGFLQRFADRYGCPYKIEYLVDECIKKYNDNCKGFIESQFGDQIHPFSFG